MKFNPIQHSGNKLRSVAHSLADAHRLRRQLRRPSGFRFVIADGIALLDPVQWDHVVAGQSFFMQRTYLHMLEEAGPENLEPRYVMIYDGEQAVAALVLQIAGVEGTRLGKSKDAPKEASAPSKRKNPLALLKKALGPAARSLQKGLHERILVCGNLLTYGFHGVAFIDGVERANIWPAIAEALYRVRRSEKLSGQTDFVLIKDITPEQLAPSSILAKLSYRELETEPNMVLQLEENWKTHADYLASLHSKYRSAVKQQITKPIEAAGLTVEHLSDISAHAERLHELYLQVHENANMRLFTLPLVYFPALAQVAGENLLCSVIKNGEEIVGFIITLKDGDTGFGYHIGFDKANSAYAELPIYLRLLHAAIADACQLGCGRLSLGRTALEPKARLGAKPEAISVWVRHRQPVMNVFVRNLLGMAHHDEAPDRNPFKK
ncbi:MAG: GNAT family N-acetyltransferase [Burkholderiales bacterium]|nr:GNAT family N-acetyltransferase [Burkholderiales bacterium]